MRPHELVALAEAILPDSGPVAIERLRHGTVNQTYRVSRGFSVYAFRIAADQGSRLGVDREWETRVVRAAGAAHLAPALVYADPQRDILVLRWTPGHAWGADQVRSARGLQRMAGLLRRIHALTPALPLRRMSPAAWIGFYHTQKTPHALASGALARLAELAEYDAVEVLCHSDLHALNMVDDGTSLRLLDWEYAHLSDPFWDVAAWCSNNDFDAAAASSFLDAYLSRPAAPAERSRLETLAWLHDYVCLLWSELYLSTAQADAVPAVAARAVLLQARLDAQLPAH